MDEIVFRAEQAVEQLQVIRFVLITSFDFYFDLVRCFLISPKLNLFIQFLLFSFFFSH